MSKKGDSKEMIGGCCVCSDERGWSENPLVYCDGAGCNVAVHQACYGIVQVPTGPWFCKKCESQERVARVKCELCPQRAGALKRTDAGGWCHVVCALYIPEAGFANVQTMEPIVLSAVPQERFNKICYICEEQKKDTKATAGACMQCNRNGCKQYFHVTCAQSQGLLCEVTGSYENVKYCGYCSHHYKKLKNHSNVKTIPAFKPIPSENSTPDSSPEKNPPPLITDENIKPQPPAIKEVKSPQVDQSVSSTSDSLPPTLIPNKPEPTGLSQVNSTGISRSCSEVSDITSVLSPTGTGEDHVKNWGSDANQEPSSSMPVADTPSLTRLALDKETSSSPENLADADIDVEVDTLPVKPPQSGSDTAINSAGPKRQRNIGSKSSSTSKKNKSGMITSTVSSHTSSSAVKERKKGTMKKRRDSGGSSSKTSSTSGIAPTNLPGHHDYCGSIFGGSPYFQSLSASGHVSLPSFTSQAYFPTFSSGSGRLLYGSDYYFDSPPVLNGVDQLLHPPKTFPSLMTDSTKQKQNQDNSHDFPLSMEQLLEQQWEQGAQFLMEQSQHFDIASLLNCLHRLKGENQNLEDRVKELTSRRDHLMAVNARLSLPLSLYDGTSSASKSSSMGSLEDISSPDDVQTPSLGPTSLASVLIPNNTELMVEDILSPAENDATSITSERLKFGSEDITTSNYSFADQACPAQPLMYSVVNPPPPTLSAMATSSTNHLSSKSLPSMSEISLSSSSLPSSSSSSSLDATSQIAGLSSLHLSSKTSSSDAKKETYL